MSFLEKFVILSYFLFFQAFYRRDALKKHISCYHENIKAFHCRICNKMFKGHLPQVTNLWQFAKIVLTFGIIFQHMRTHNQIKTHGCAACGALFSQRSQLIVHQRIHSGVNFKLICFLKFLLSEIVLAGTSL